MNRIKKLFFVKFSILFILFFFAEFSLAQKFYCPFNKNDLQFSGLPAEQARCLLRTVKPRGILGEPIKTLPQPLKKLIGEKVKIKKESFRKYLQRNKITEDSIGGSLDERLSIAILPNGEEMQALYFIIHDVSAPNYLLKPFPENINDSDWEGNNLSKWLKTPVAHVFVNRAGESVSVVRFGSVLPEKRFGTKFARDYLKEKAKGLQIHVELVQPRRSDPDWFAGNDAFAPDHGFTDEQYERLALLYIAASVRRGLWLIPGFHCAVDAGIPEAHDDPQNFDLAAFARKLNYFYQIFR